MGRKEKNKRAEIGDIKLSDIKGREGKPIICINIESFEDGSSLYEWEDYETYILRTREGMGVGSYEVHTLQYFAETLDVNKLPRKEKGLFDLDISAITRSFIIPMRKQLMGAKSAYTSKETTKIYVNHVRKVIEILEEAVKRLERIKEDDYVEKEEK